MFENGGQLKNKPAVTRHTIIKGNTLAMAALGLAWHFPVQAHEDPEDDHLIEHKIGGVQVEGGLTWFLQSTSGAADDTSALSYTLDIGLEAPVSKHGKAVVALEAGDGEGVDPAVGALSAVNYDAFFTELTNAVGGSTNVVVPSISQAFYEGEYMAGDLLVSIGKLDAHSMFDDNAYANDETDQFLSAIFTRSADTSYKQLDYYYAPGLALQYALSEMVDVTLIAANGNKSGFNDVFNNMYTVGQLNLKPGFAGREGNYRFYVINDRRNSENTVFTEIASGRTTDNTGWGLSFDQALPGGVGVFARYSAQDDTIKENTVESSWSLGALFAGLSWGREHDTAGVGYGSVNLNTAPAALAAYNAGDDGSPGSGDDLGIINFDDETHLEVFYKFGFSHHFTLTADLQVIGNSGGNADADTVTVTGLRGQLNF